MRYEEPLEASVLVKMGPCLLGYHSSKTFKEHLAVGHLKLPLFILQKHWLERPWQVTDPNRPLEAGGLRVNA